ncbi:MAG: Hpt domain-containing protein [Thermoanaerobaculia bacterium]|jgi:chemotaxis protein histidine kinase CheA
MNPEFLAELAEQFRVSAIERLVVMRELVARFDANRADRETLVLIHRHFHGLAGLGGTYGFPRVSELAADVESACDDALAAAPADDAFIALLRSGIEAIGREVAKK